MKISFCLILLFVFSVAYSGEKADSSKTKLKAGASVSLNSNGVAPVPAFSLGKPAIIATITLAKNRLSYEPQLGYSIDLRPWYIDNWLRVKLIDKPSFEFRTGFNVSSFFVEYNLTDEQIWQAQKYFVLELTGVYKISPESSLLVAYWHDIGQDKGTLQGHFLNFVGERSNIKIGKSVLFSAALQLFYINYNGNNDGLFLSPKISSSTRNMPLSIFFQGIQALDSNISPSPGFRWNLGLSYNL